MPRPLIFVYGSLRQGAGRDGLLAAFPRRSGGVRGRIYRLPAGEPALEPDPEAALIRGEVVELQVPGMLRVLDLIRAGPNRVMERRRVQVIVDLGPELAAWAFVLRRGEARRRGLLQMSARDWRDLSPRSDL